MQDLGSSRAMLEIQYENEVQYTRSHPHFRALFNHLHFEFVPLVSYHRTWSCLGRWILNMTLDLSR